jgi:Flp pilus assembly protein TadD
VLDPRNGSAPGFDRGFDRYDAGFRIRRPGEDRYQSVERRGDEVVSRALKWIGDAGSGPWFAWVHLYDAHDPYDPPADLKARFAAAPYDGEIAGLDRLVSRLLRAATTPQTLVAIAADHGEALGDHGEDTHGVFLYEPVVRVPLVVRLPDGRGAGARIATRVRLADLAPTILAAVRQQVPAAIQGESLLPLVSGANGVDRPAYSETDYPRQAFGWAPLAAWRSDRFLFVRAPRPELYDLTADGDATRNLVETRGRVVQGMSAELDRFERQSRGTATPNAGANDRSRSRAAPGRARLRERIGRCRRVGRNGGSQRPHRHRQPASQRRRRRRGRGLPESDSDARAGHRVGAEHPARAAAARRGVRAAAAVRARPADVEESDGATAGEHVRALRAGGGDVRNRRAASGGGEFKLVATRMPRWADARFSLGSVYARIDRVADAVIELRAAIDLEPRHFRANLLLGRIFTLQNQPAAAVPLLRTATDVDPASAEAHSFLADAYEKAGNTADAAKERERARALAKP